MLALTLVAIADPIGTWARARMARDHIPAMVVGVYRNGKPLKVGVYGTIDLRRGIPARRDTEFEICSVTKQFTAAAVLLLVQDKKLSLNDSLAKFFPGAPRAWREIALRDALHHLSGLPDAMFEVRKGGATEGGALRAAFEAAPLRLPRPRWAYDNTPYLLLGRVVERTSGTNLWTFLKRRVFDPLGMRHTRPNDRPNATGRVRGYLWRAGRFADAQPLGAALGGGAGGLLSTVDDLARWSDALQRGALLKPASRAAMLAPGRLRSGEVAWNEASDGYGFGVFLSGSGGHRIEKHSGGWPSASAQLTRLPDDGLTIVVLTNRGLLPERYWWGEEIAEIVTGRRWLPVCPVVRDPNPARTARIAAVLRNRGVRFGALGFMRAIPQGDATAFQFQTTAAPPRLVTAWRRGGEIEELRIDEIPATRLQGTHKGP